MAEELSFGADYYPEQWEESRWETDADRMKAFGIDTVRIMEFGWCILEPEAGSYDFSLFDRAIEVLASRGIKIILGTPTATFPAWLLDQGEVLQLSRQGVKRDFGTRRMGCYNSPAYKAAAENIVRAVAKHYGQDRRIIGWQVDNEFGHEGSDRCVCDNCRRAWQLWLERRYGRVDVMNRQWGSVFWSTMVTRWDQVPLPREQVSAHFSPQLLLDYDRFCSDSAIDFIDAQVAILKSSIHADAFITTNLFPPPMANAIDMERLTRDMNFASWDNYPSWGDQDQPLPYMAQALAESYIRGISKEGNFTVMEAFSGFQGHVCLGYLPPEKQVALWANQAVARGANRVLYFRWRTVPYGQEQLCYGIFDSDNADTRRSQVIRNNISEAKSLAGKFASTPMESEACLLYSKDDARVLSEQYLSQGLSMKPTPWIQAGYDLEMNKWFAPFVLFNVNTDVKSVASARLDHYKLISLPLYQMADPAFVGRLDDWVKAGGQLILGYRSGTRDLRDWNVESPLPGLFAEMAGIRVPRFESLNKGRAGIRIGLLPAKAEVWADIVEPTTAKVLARYADRKKFYSKAACVTVNSWGKGRVWYIGTSLDPMGIFLIYRRIFKAAGLGLGFKGVGIEALRRRTEAGAEVKVVLNHTAKTRRAFGRRIEPYGWTVIE